MMDLSEAYRKVVGGEVRDLGMIPRESAAEKEAREKTRQLLLNQKPEEAIKKIYQPASFSLDGYYSLCCLVYYLYFEKAPLTLIETISNEISSYQKSLIEINKNIKDIESNKVSSVTNANTQPTNAPQSIKDKLFSLFTSVLLNKLSIIIISLCVGVAFFVVIVGCFYVLLHKFRLI